MTTSDDDSAPSPDAAAPPRPDRPDRRSNAAILAYAVAVVGAVVAAVVTPVGDRVVQSFFDEPTCPGTACEGKSPEKQGCGEDARTYKPNVGNPAALQIRHSEDCRAVWAKIQQGNPGDLVTVQVTGGARRTAEIEFDHDKFTNMVSVPDGEFRVTACAVPKAGGESTFERYCIDATEATVWQ